jgi:hypothetical protein
LDVTWPNGYGGLKHMSGRGRDLLSRGPERQPHTISEDSIEAVFDPDWQLSSISASTARDRLQLLVGQAGNRGFRKAVRERVLPDLSESPLLLVLEDVPNVVMVSSAAWPEWDENWRRHIFGDVPISAMLKFQAGACIAHAEGSSAQNAATGVAMTAKPDAVDPAREDDPEGWHVMPDQHGAVGFRRTRRIDVECGDEILIDAEFQDSATKPKGGRIAIHEYGLKIIADRKTLEIRSIETDPRVLPYAECPSAAMNLPRLFGRRLDGLRDTVPAVLPGVAGCTHLNDALRALADVPFLLGHLEI